MSYADHKKNLKKVMLQMMKEGGKDINEILDMPFSFFMELVNENEKPNVEHKESMIDAFM
ncbi:MAG: hypothetical protein L0J87_12240 [Tetragenococcus koreensis]|nr:hypothetical protein [Tetragenococcus koreensis]